MVLGQHVRTHLALGKAAWVEADPGRARAHFEAALAAPPNLGEAAHRLANQSEVWYWLGCALAAEGRASPCPRSGTFPRGFPWHR